MTEGSERGQAVVPGPLVRPYRDHWPVIAADAFVAPGAVVIGDVVIGAEASLWYGVVVRGDVHFIRIGARTNLQDGTVVHVTRRTAPTEIGDNVTVGHGAVIHGAVLESACFIGMRATVLDGVVVESGAMVAAGAVVSPGKRVPRGEIWAGIPARPLRALSPAESAFIQESADNYVALGREHRDQV